MADINVIVLPDGTEYPVSDYYLPVAIFNPTAGQVLKYDATNQVWYNGDDAEGSSVFYGTSAPTSQLGVDGNLYVKYTEGTGGASDTVDALYVKLDGAWCQISTGGGGGTSDYNDLTNKPQINSVELSGNKSLDDLGIQPSEISKTATGSIVTFSDGGDNIPVESFECEIVAQQASGIPTPSSPLPITGHSESDILVSGKNLFDESQIANASGWSESGGVYTGAIVQLYVYANNGFPKQPKYKENTRYTLSVYINTTNAVSRFRIYYTDGTYSDLALASTTAGTTQTVTTTPNKTVDKIAFTYNSGGDLSISKIQLEEGTSASDYAPYTGNLYTVSFGQTIYGGKLVYANAKWFIRATHGEYVFDGTETPITYGSGYRYVVLTGKEGKSYGQYNTPNAISNQYVAISRNNIQSGSTGFSLTGDTILLSTDTPTGIQIVYELASPVIIPITSSTRVKTISGDNNIYSSTGDCELKYFTNKADGIEELINVSETSAENTTIDDTNLAYEADNVQEAFEKITKSLTWAEYQTLSEEEKNNGTAYFITDVNGDGQDFQPVIYSEDEREIGVWIDGRPVYEKTLTVGTIASGTTFAHGITNLDWIIDYSLFGIYAGGNTKLISPANGSSSSIGFVISSWDSTNITFTKGNLSSNFSDCYCIIRYTKTTDQPGSGTWTPQGVPAVHYSEDEQVVGTWIDGKTLYEKTIYIPNLPNNSDIEYETGLSNVVQRGFDAHILFPSGNISKLPYINAANNNRVAIQFNANGKIQILTQYNNSGNAAYVTIRYTKSS